MREVIEMSLNPKDLDFGIRKLLWLKKTLQARMDDVGEELVRRGVLIAKQKVADMDAVYTGQLMASIDGWYDRNTHTGAISTNGVPYAAYVEYGTGIVGAMSYHPKADDWDYDLKHHGYEGWYYLNDRDGRVHWTAGFKSRPFMYETAEELQDMAPKVAKEILKR